MHRRIFMGALAATLTLTGRASGAESQPAHPYRIGFLGITSASEFTSRVDALRAGLRDLGYVEGKNVLIEYRWADGDANRLPALAAELVRLKVDVLVTHAEGTMAAKRATTTIPIVMAYTADAVATGLVTSLARPEANITGSTALIPEMSAKRLELLKAAAPRTAQVGVLVRKETAWEPILNRLQSASKASGLNVQFFEVQDPAGLESSFSEMAKERIDSLLVSEDPVFAYHSKQIADLAAKYRWPSSGFRGHAEAGGLIGYGVDTLKVYRHAAVFVDKILKGTKPADLPIEQPTNFDLVINLKTAKALRLTVPQSLLLRADEVIQ